MYNHHSPQSQCLFCLWVFCFCLDFVFWDKIFLCGPGWLWILLPHPEGRDSNPSHRFFITMSDIESAAIIPISQMGPWLAHWMPYKPMCLNTWCQDGGTVWRIVEPLGWEEHSKHGSLGADLWGIEPSPTSCLSSLLPVCAPLRGTGEFVAILVVTLGYALWNMSQNGLFSFKP